MIMHSEVTPLPTINNLGHAGRMHLLADVEMSLLLGKPFTQPAWREAWGRAVDYQMVTDVRRELARADVRVTQ